MSDPRLDRELERIRAEAPPPGLEDRLTKLVPDVVAPVRPLPSLAMCTLMLCLVLLFAGIVPGVAAGAKGWKALDWAQRAGIAGVLGVSFVWLSFELARRLYPGARLRVPAMVVSLSTLAVLTAWVIAATGFQPNPILFLVACIAFTSVCALASASLVILCLRRGVIVSPSSVAWLVGAATAMAGFVAVEVFCKIVETAHILTSHVLPAILVGALAGLGARRFLR